MMVVFLPVIVGMGMVVGMGVPLVLVGMLMSVIMGAAVALMGMVLQGCFFTCATRAEALDGNNIGRFAAALAHGLASLEMMGLRAQKPCCS